ncbi:MAG TPA: hypothetical protein VNE40_00990 [Candidatus Dormibacteraeota bacterium]|nr:hypothetical protein [Candidatus Dormibacteraeota bacterium]
MNSDFGQSIEVFLNGQKNCKTSAIDCIDYHYIRPVLRYIGAVASPYDHRDFFRQWLAETISLHENPAVTVSGAADYAWLLPNSPLTLACNNKLTPGMLTVVDGCTTPLTACLEFAQSVPAFAVRKVQSNIPNGLGVKDQDVIVTDAFLTQFADATHRKAVLHAWRSSLAQDGTIITTVQVRPANGQRSATKEVFLLATTQLYEESPYPDALRLSSSDFLGMVGRVAGTNHTKIYASESELMEEISGSDLTVTHMEAHQVYSKSSQRILEYRGLVIQK